MTAPIEQGDTYLYRQTVTDSSGTPADAGTVSATVTLPDGTTATPTVIHAGTGLYDFDYTTTQVGRHTLFGTATGGALGTATQNVDDVFHVETPGRFIVGFNDAVSQLRGALTITTLDDREQLRWLCLVASDAIERDLDLAVIRKTVVEYHDGGGAFIDLRQYPVLSVSTVVEDGLTLDPDPDNGDYVVDLELGTIRRGGRKSLSCWRSGYQIVAVTYLAGMTATPPVLRLVALYLIQSLWQSSQQSPHSLLDEDSLEGTGLQAIGLLAGLPRPLQRAYNRMRNAA